jgi:hypothetical protein
MSTADAVPTTNPSIELTKKGDRAATGASAHRNAVAEKQRLYIVAAGEVERLLAFLDRLDGDPDLEANGDLEPSLAGVGFDPTGGDDRELDQSDDEPDVEGEPLLGAPEAVTTYTGEIYGWPPEGIRRTSEGRQTPWAKGNTSDLEGDAKEDDEDDGGGIGDIGGLCEQTVGEASLGATTAINQVMAWHSSECSFTDGEPEFASLPREDAFDRHPPTCYGKADVEDDCDMEHSDQHGIADRDAAADPDCQFERAGDWDGSGHAIARRQLLRIGR